MTATAFREKLEFAHALPLPTFVVDGMELIKRMTMVVRVGKIVTVFYPVSPSDKNAGKVIRW